MFGEKGLILGGMFGYILSYCVKKETHVRVEGTPLLYILCIKMGCTIHTKISMMRDGVLKMWDGVGYLWNKKDPSSNLLKHC